MIKKRCYFVRAGYIFITPTDHQKDEDVRGRETASLDGDVIKCEIMPTQHFEIPTLFPLIIHFLESVRFIFKKTFPLFQHTYF